MYLINQILKCDKENKFCNFICQKENHIICSSQKDFFVGNQIRNLKLPAGRDKPSQGYTAMLAVLSNLPSAPVVVPKRWSLEVFLSL